MANPKIELIDCSSVSGDKPPHSNKEIDSSNWFLTGVLEKQEIKCEDEDIVDVQEDCDMNSDEEVAHQTHKTAIEKTKQTKNQNKTIQILTEMRRYRNCKSDRPASDPLCKRSENINRLKRQRIKTKLLKRFYCQTCDKSFFFESQLQVHENGVHLQLKPFLCKYCDKTFSNKINMIGHVNCIHTQLKSYKCNVCEKTFAFKSNLNKHRKSVHLGLRPHVCELCQSGFAQRGHLLTHERTVHGGIRPFACHICDKGFVRKIDLDGHINCEHLKVKPFKCEDCGKIFGRKNVLTTHRKSVHLKVRPFSCDVCGESYAAKKELIKHLAKHSDKKTKKRLSGQGKKLR